MIEEYEIENMIVNDIAGTDERQEWKIDNDSTADWAIEKIREANAEFARKEIVAKNKIVQITDWLKKQEEERDRTKSFFEAKLREYFETLPENAKKKAKTQSSYKLPSGTLKLKFREPEIIRDEEKLLAWVKQNKPRFVKIKESVDWAGLKELTKIDADKVIDMQTGEIVDGIEVKEREPEFAVEVK